MAAPTPYADARTLPRFLRQAFILAGMMLGSLALYLAVLKWRGPAATVTTRTAWDDAIPYRPGWVWAYLLPYLVGPFIAGLLSPSSFRWYVRRGLLVVAVSLAIFAAFPTRVERPTTDAPAGGLTGRIYRNMVEVDEPPANAAPSLHVSLTFLLALAVVRDDPRWGLAALGGAAVVWLATLLTWQHHLIDVATGVLLAGIFALPWSTRAPYR
jgi:hypothetical protein